MFRAKSRLTKEVMNVYHTFIDEDNNLQFVIYVGEEVNEVGDTVSIWKTSSAEWWIPIE